MANSIEEQVEDWCKKQLDRYFTKTEKINDEIEKALETAPSKKGGDGNNYPDIKLNKTTFDYSKNNNFNLNKKKNTNYIFGNNNIYKNNRFYNNDFYPDIKLNHNKLNYSYNNSYINYNKNIRNRNNYFPDIKLNNSFFDYSKKNSNVNRKYKDDLDISKFCGLIKSI